MEDCTDADETETVDFHFANGWAGFDQDVASFNGALPSMRCFEEHVPYAIKHSLWRPLSILY